MSEKKGKTGTAHSAPKLPPKARKLISEHKKATHGSSTKKGPEQEKAAVPGEEAAPSSGLSAANEEALKAQAPPPVPDHKVGDDRDRHIVREPRPDATYVRGDYYQISTGSGGIEKIRGIADPIKRQETIVRRMRIRSDVDPPSKDTAHLHYKQDLETIFRVVEGVPMVGSRGPTIHQTIAKKGA